MPYPETVLKKQLLYCFMFTNCGSKEKYNLSSLLSSKYFITHLLNNKKDDLFHS